MPQCIDSYWLWQKTDKGKIAGINMDVDISYFPKYIGGIDPIPELLTAPHGQDVHDSVHVDSQITNDPESPYKP
jgi:GH25 family lysozyme M1 (1,4-beta-N-acetylmuramidase)